MKRRAQVETEKDKDTPQPGEAGEAGEGSAGKGASAAQAQRPRSRARFYDRVLTEEEVAALAGAASAPALEDEIGLLRVLIRRKLEEGGDLATISKAVDSLGRALKVQKQISAEGHQALQDALLAVLAELDNELDGKDAPPKKPSPRRKAQAGDTVVR